ncbi:hypothetical protein Tcan_02393 [Toxocara canis]|uniref:Uncharacterized protein n=1 Tax=Toxocara canis TaxID=6265 RepID=A0A0B2UQ88_TOXCA|nr:hypothetical protein Tcan_02393 [Toxocara canis]
MRNTNLKPSFSGTVVTMAFGEGYHARNDNKESIWHSVLPQICRRNFSNA